MDKKEDYLKETEVFKTPSLNIIAPRLEESGIYESLFYLVVSTERASSIAEKEFKHHKKELFQRLWLSCPSTLFLDKIKRSIPSLEERLTIDKIQYLRLAANTEQDISALEMLEERFTYISEYVASIPLCIVNKDLSILNCRLGAGRLPVLLNWNKIGVEPICSNIPSKQLERFVIFDELLSNLKESRDDCEHLTVEHLELSGLLGDLDRYILKKHYTAGIELIPAILSVIELLEMDS